MNRVLCVSSFAPGARIGGGTVNCLACIRTGREKASTPPSNKKERSKAEAATALHNRHPFAFFNLDPRPSRRKFLMVNTMIGSGAALFPPLYVSRVFSRHARKGLLRLFRTPPPGDPSSTQRSSHIPGGGKTMASDAAKEFAELWGSDSDDGGLGGGGGGGGKGGDDDDVWGSDSGDDTGGADAARKDMAEREEKAMRKKHYNVFPRAHNRSLGHFTSSCL